MIISILCCALFVLLCLLTGYSILCALQGQSQMHWALIFGLSTCLGEGAVGLILVFASMLGLLPSRIPQSFIAIAALLGIGLLSYRRRLIKPIAVFDSSHRLFNTILLVAILYSFIVVLLDATIWPVIEWDAYSIWQLKSKVLLLATLRSHPPYFSDLNLSFSHLRYPPLVPMISAAASSLLGRPDDFLFKAPHVLLFFAMAGLVYGAVEIERGTRAALIATALLITAPTILHYAASGTAETALTAFTTAACVCIIRWLKLRKPPDFALACLFSIFSAWTKNEGLPIACINGIILLTTTPKPLRHLSAVLGFFCAIAVAFAPWPFYTRVMPRTDEDYLTHVSIAEFVHHIHRLPYIIKNILTALSDRLHWGIFWVFFLVITLLRCRVLAVRPAAAMLMAVLLQLALYMTIYTITPMTLDADFFSATAHRLFMHTAPAAAILIGLLWPGGNTTSPFDPNPFTMSHAPDAG